MATPFLLNGVALFNLVISPVNVRFCRWERSFLLVGTPVSLNGNSSSL
ncbi:hypothetical protein [Bacteroides intestinalis]|nr:hypothetical protein [Bacteroides intestinalis]